MTAQPDQIWPEPKVLTLIKGEAEVPPQLLRVAEAAGLLGISERTMWRWVKAGHIPHVRLGPFETVIRVPASALAEYVAGKMKNEAATGPDLPIAAKARDQRVGHGRATP